MNHRLQNTIETLVRGFSERLHKKIGEWQEERRDHARLAQKAVVYAQAAGYKEYHRSWLGSEDWDGELREYPVTFRFDTARMTSSYDGDGVVFLPVYIKDTGLDDRRVELLAINLCTEDVTPVYTSGTRWFHYKGGLKIYPLMVQSDRYTRREGYGTKAQVVYEVERTPSLEEYGTLEPYVRLLTTGTTAEREIHLAEVPLACATKEVKA